VTGLERRYRLLLRVLPRWYRAVWEQDMVATFLAGVEAEVAGDEQADLVGEYGWPDRAEVVSVLALAVRLRLGGAPAYAQSWAWGAAARRVALVVLLVHAVWSVLDVGLTAWFSVAVPASSAPPDPTDAPSLGEWVLTLAGLVWLAAYLALLAGRPHVAGGLAAVGLAQVAVLRVQNVLLTHAPIVAAAAAAVSVVVPALLLLGLAAFHRDAPLPRRRPWLTALGVGLVVGSALAVLVIRTADAGPAVWVFLHPDAVFCVLVVVAGTVCLARRVVRPGGGPAWPLALAVLAAAALTLRLTSLWALPEADWLASRTAGLAQIGAALAAATVLAVVGARDLSRLPATHHPEPPLQY
jgi:hypothetical protein